MKSAETIGVNKMASSSKPKEGAKNFAEVPHNFADEDEED